MPYHVYIIFSSTCDRYYIDHTASISKRIQEHNIGKRGKFFCNCMPWTLVYFEQYNSRSDAMKRKQKLQEALELLIVQ